MLMKTHQPTEFPHTVIILSVFQQVLSSLTGITRSCRNFQSTEGQTADKASLLEAHPPPLSKESDGACGGGASQGVAESAAERA